MAIAPYITPKDLGMRPANYTYFKGGVSIDVEAFTVYYDEEGNYNEYNIDINSILSWSIEPDSFFYNDEEDGFKKVFLNSVFVYDANGDPIEFGAAYPAARVAKITIKILENKNVNTKKYTLDTSLFKLTVAYLPDYLKGKNKIDNQVSKNVFCTAPYKLYTNDYLILKNKEQTIQGIAISNTTSYIQKGTIESEENRITFVGDYTPATFHVKYSTLGKKDIIVTLYFNDDFLIKELKLMHEDILNVQEVYEDYNTVDKLRFVDDFVKVDDIPPYIAPNEFVIEDNINSVFRKMHDCLERFLLEQKIVNPAVTKRIGWYNTNKYVWNTYVNNVNGSYEYFEPIENQTPIVDVFATDYEFYYIKDNTIHELTKLYNTSITAKIKNFNEGAPFLNIKNVVLDSKKKMFVLDAGASRIGIFQKNFTRTSSTWTNQLYFGGTGGRNAKNKFLLPNSIFLDNYDNLHVVDTGNGVIKKYSNDGTWLTTMISELFDNTIINGLTDSDYNYHILKPKTVAKVDSETNTILEYKLFNPDSIPIKIITEPRRDFLFVIYRTKVQKYHKSGKYIATIYGSENVSIAESDYFLPCQDLYNFYWSWDALSCAQSLDLNPVSITWNDTGFQAQYSKTWGNQTTRLEGDSSNSNLDFNIYSGCIDQTRNLYITVGGYLQKLLVNTNFLYLGDELKEEYYWELNDIFINKEEIVQDITYNRSFQRMWDNIELVRKSVVKKMNVVTGSYITKYFTKRDFDNLKLFEKSTIVFGQNEIVTTDVVNRNIEKLWHNINAIKNMLNYRDLLTDVESLTARQMLTTISTQTSSVTGNNGQPPVEEDAAEAYFSLGFVGDATYPEFIVKILGNEKISKARSMIVGQEEALSITGTVIPQKESYNPNYSYHLDPSTINFFVEGPTLCDADPVYVENNLPVWVETAKTWCPGSSYILAEKSL
jgi:hypothetical protein